MEILEHHERPFPQDSDGRLGAFLNVVNTEFKLVTYLHLDDSPADGSEIRARIKKTIGRGAYFPQERCIEDYGHHTLFPIGLVAEERALFGEGREARCYRLTEAGRLYKPLAALTLDYVVETNRSLFKILGNFF